MKIRKRFITIIILAMAIGLITLMPIPESKATITEDTNTGSITITGLEAGVTVYAYQFITVNYDYDADQPSDPEYTWCEWTRNYVSTCFSEDNLNTNLEQPISDSDYNVTDYYSELTSEELDDILAELASGATKATTGVYTVADGSATYPVTEEECTETITLETMEMGSYFIFVTNGYRVYNLVVANLIPVYEQESSQWILEDQVVSCKSTTPYVSITSEEPTFSSTDTITLNIECVLPAQSVSATQDYTLTIGVEGPDGAIEDIECTGLMWIGENYSDNQQVLDSVTSALRSDSCYKLESGASAETNALAQPSTITLTLEAQSFIESLDSIGASFTVTITSDQEPNTYSCLAQTLQDTLTIYTYGIQTVNVDNNDKTTLLQNSTFNLCDSSGNALSFVETNGTYYLSDSSSTSTALVTDSDGIVTIYGLDVGTYTLSQIAAAGGYALNTTSVEIDLADDDLNGLLDYDSGDDNGIYEVTFTNVAGYSLPTTGGFGTTMFAVMGIVLIATGGVLIIVKSRKKS